MQDRPVTTRGVQGFAAVLTGAVLAVAATLAPTSAWVDSATRSVDPPAPTAVTISIAVGGAAHGYVNPEAAVAQGGSVTIVNGDNVSHTVTSDAVGTDGDPLFNFFVSARTTKTFSIAGLAGGEYDFYCVLHPGMRGTLTIVGGPVGEVPSDPPFEQALRVPKVLTGSNITIPMKKGKVRVMAHGPKTEMWTYGGSFPGPTIKRPTGKATKVTFVHKLPKKAGSMTVHNHGGHQSSKDDGQPTTYLIGKGGKRTYTYPLSDNSKPVPAYFAFYHDHKMDATARNNWRGLQGMFLVTDKKEDRLRLPKGKYDVPLHVSDRTFTSGNQLTNPFKHAGHAGHSGGGMHDWMTGPTAPPNDATVGNRILVNGQYAPYFRVKPGLYRLRLLNASLFSAYDFALSNGRPFVQVGTGNGLLPAPVTRQDVLLGPAQRADVVVDFRGLEGQDLTLRSIPRSDGTGTGSRSATLMQFRVRGSTDQRARVPAKLTKIEDIKAPRKVSKTWTFGLDKNSHGSFWSINDKMYDPDRVDHRVRMNSVERWRLRNVSDMTHYVHLHEERWQTLSRDGAEPPPWEAGYEDTWRLDPGESVDVFARFTDFPGLFMVHCHMLDHEDHGMMAQFEVLPRGGS
jgi:spore coat protein A